jgi:hypothetical protein
MALHVLLQISVYLVYVAALLPVPVCKPLVKTAAKIRNAAVITAPLEEFVFLTQEGVVN